MGSQKAPSFGAYPPLAVAAALSAFRAFWSAFSRTSFMMGTRLWLEGSPYRIRESSALVPVVSRLVWVWSVVGKPNGYNANANPLTIEWE